jgi:hypothetical protein
MTAATRPNDRDVIAAHVATAITRHREQAGFVRLVAEELPPREQSAWLAVAACLTSGNVAEGIKAADTSLAPWVPLFASPSGDPRLPARILQAAVGLRCGGGHTRWAAIAYPAVMAVLALGLLAFLSVTVLATFESIFRDFGLELPLLTKATLAIRPFIASVWQPLTAVAVVVIVGRWLLTRRMSSSAGSTADFTRCLARLVASTMPPQDAVAVAGRLVTARPLDTAAPRRPLTYAATAALDCEPHAAAILLDAIAAAHEDLCRGSSGAGPLLVGPALIAVIAVLVGFVLLGLLLPLMHLINALS